ncbi:MAG: 2-oxoglutarate oxidoreductase [Muribaculaceae bacterium]|nr:2-oxoglutarate oxidoreductase [Muribaculaceae bacterium]MDE5958719.1 2-oxoglutarate oxidoreductase [Muribaculaceae bacterium]MDE5971152.1 2-oxoglutarate oxidoreductase [Muribaculaceae bacterium]MDE6316101.1 2-oxoglutarate oxidoreductase [Muribaculaceae bacterium]MDE6462088.1 2-oxoglutarate oxidoreductase [Muribaculaceae bacterium]
MTREDIIKDENKVYSRPRLLLDATMHYCPGCSHGVVHKLVAEVLEELGMEDTAIGVAPVGCAVFAYNYIDIDWIEAAHGRAPAVATAVSRLQPDNVVFTYQGDGDLAAIGTAETIHACTRGENIMIIFINNGIYGMTGGQMAPTTLEGMKTSTTPYGRRADINGFPVKISDIAAMLDGTCYVTRQAVHTPAAVRSARKAIRQALINTREKRGTSFVEIVSTCSSGWKLSPVKANKWMEENMFAKYPLGDIKNTEVKK